ncbi:unnamed protein product [Lampetra fluviatilis]
MEAPARGAGPAPDAGTPVTFVSLPAVRKRADASSSRAAPYAQRLYGSSRTHSSDLSDVAVPFDSIPSLPHSLRAAQCCYDDTAQPGNSSTDNKQGYSRDRSRLEHQPGTQAA